MEFIACILISIVSSWAYTNLRINQYDKVITDHISNSSEITFEMVLKLLKKAGIIKE